MTTRYQLAASIRLEGMLVFRPSELEFDPSYEYTYCRICGMVFQTARDRDPFQNFEDLLDNMEIRRNWSLRHSRTHPDHLHRTLQKSKLWALPEAAEKLATYGILAVGSAVLNEEVRHALYVAGRLPDNDAEGT